LPSTGFTPNTVTTLPEQPVEKLYSAADLRLEIPNLAVNVSIVGVPLINGTWDLSWLDQQAGWLNGTAFPTWMGNSVLTGHVYLANGRPGPFVDLASLKWGDRVIIHANGSSYIYEVRENRTVAPTNTSVFKHEDSAWLTLITCKSFNEKTDSYSSRVVIRALLIKVEADKPGSVSRNER
jgi:LPXTG-site transpeptidase (sortase) family protein